MGVRDSLFQFPTDGTPRGARHDVAGLLDALRLAPIARKVLHFIFERLWPDELPKPLDQVKVSMQEITASTGYSKSSVSPWLVALKADGWLATSGRGDVYRINWQQLFALDDQPATGPVQSVQSKLWTGPIDPLDRSSGDRAVLDRLDRSAVNELGDKLDRSSFEDPTDWTGPEHIRDAFTPLEKLANQNAELASILFAIGERFDAVEELRTVCQRLTEKLDRLDRLDRSNQSNRSNSDPICMSYKNVIHDMECGELEDSEKTAAQPATASDAKPIQEAPPMTLDAFKWPDDLYEPGKGLLPACLEMPTGRERLYQHAVLQGGWPDDAQGRLEFHATVIYCRRTSDNPGATLTTAVRGKKWGRAKWFAKQDLKDATASIGRHAPPPPEVPTQRKPSAPPRDWSEVDRRIDAMTDDDAFELIPETNSFLRGYFNQARAKGDARKQPTIRHALRSILDPTPKPQPAAPAPVTPGLDLAGLDLEVTRR